MVPAPAVGGSSTTATIRKKGWMQSSLSTASSSSRSPFVRGGGGGSSSSNSNSNSIFSNNNKHQEEPPTTTTSTREVGVVEKSDDEYEDYEYYVGGSTNGWNDVSSVLTPPSIAFSTVEPGNGQLLLAQQQPQQRMSSGRQSLFSSATTSMSSVAPPLKKEVKIEHSLQSIQNVAERLLPTQRKTDQRMSQKGFTLNQLRFSSLNKLYGREKEIATLFQALERTIIRSNNKHSSIMANNNNNKDDETTTPEGGEGEGPIITEVVMISGYSGTGKSALAQKLEEPSCRQHHGCFCSGKYDLHDHRGKIPYSAIVTALSNLVEGIVQRRATAASNTTSSSNDINNTTTTTKRGSSDDDDQFQQLQSKLTEIVGQEVEYFDVLKPVIPNLSLLLSKQRQLDHHHHHHHGDEGEGEGEASAPLSSSEETNNTIGGGGGRTAGGQEQQQQQKQEGEAKLKSVVSDSDVDTTTARSSTATVGSAEEKAKLLFLLRKVMKAICDVYCPVVLHLDDLQWIDSGSVDLIRALATDRDITGLLIVGCYRSNEVADDVDHKLPLFLKQIEKPSPVDGKEQVRLTSISVGNLDTDSIKNLLDDLLRTDIGDPSSCNNHTTEALAKVLHARTFGNVFFVIQFLNTLRKNDLLTFNFADLSWRWDEEEIENRMTATDNVAALMELEIENHLSIDAQKSLQLAACLGNEFDESTLVLLVTKMNEEGSSSQDHTSSSFSWHTSIEEGQVKQWLEQCVEGGFLYKRSDSLMTSYRFVHDVIQEAALSFIEQQDLVRFCIGKVLVENLPCDMLERNLFMIVDVFNHGAKLQALDQSRSLLISLNLRAGKKALQSSAFEASAEYLAFSIKLLGHDCWDDTNYASSLDLFSTAALAEFCNGNLTQCRGHIDQVLAQTQRPILDKLPAYVCLIDSHTFQTNLSLSLETNVMVLKQCGVDFGPEALLPLATVSSLLKTKKLLHNMSADDLLRLPRMTDKTKLMAMKLMDRALNSCYMLNSPYFAVVEFKMVRWSVKHGVCSQSSVAFAVYGLLLTSLGELQKARVFGEVADNLSQRPGMKETRSRILMQSRGYVFHWTSPVRTCLKPLLLGYEVGMKDGDLENAFYSAYLYAKLAICAGRALHLVLADLLDFTAQMMIYSQETIYQMCLPHWQFVAIMTGKSAPESLTLSGEIMDFDEQMEDVIKSNHVYLQDVLRLNQLQLAFYFGDYKRAWEMVEASKNFDKSNISHVTVWRRAFYVGMTAFCLARRASNDGSFIQSGKWKRKGKQELTRLKKWLVAGNVNCAHLLYLLEAEELALCHWKSGREEALPLFQKAISMASRAGFIHDAALAAERTAEYLSSRPSCSDDSSRERVCDYIQLAITSYAEWGASAKVDQLKQEWSSRNNIYSQSFGKHRESSSHGVIMESL